MTAAIDAARERLMASMLAEWDMKDVAVLARLLRQLADDALRSVQARGPLQRDS